MLVVVYFFLALSIGRPLLFEAAGSVLFALATIKYIYLSRDVHLRIVKRKILIDLLGSILCAASFTNALGGDAGKSAWIQMIVFAVANVYLLAVRPMYRIEVRV